MIEKLYPCYKLLKTEVPINITSELKEVIHSVIKVLSDARQLALKKTHSRKAARLNDGCQLQHCWLCRHDSRQSRTKDAVKAENVRPMTFGSKVFFTAQLKKVHILKRIFGNILGISSVCTHSLGINKANNLSDREQIRHTFFPNKGNPDSTLECIRICVAV